MVDRGFLCARRQQPYIAWMRTETGKASRCWGTLLAVLNPMRRKSIDGGPQILYPYKGAIYIVPQIRLITFRPKKSLSRSNRLATTAIDPAAIEIGNVWGHLLECVHARFLLFPFMTYLCPAIEAGCPFFQQSYWNLVDGLLFSPAGPFGF